MSGVPTSSQSTPALTAISAVGIASARVWKSSDSWTLGVPSKRFVFIKLLPGDAWHFTRFFPSAQDLNDFRNEPRKRVPNSGSKDPGLSATGYLPGSPLMAAGHWTDRGDPSQADEMQGSLAIQGRYFIATDQELLNLGKSKPLSIDEPDFEGLKRPAICSC